MTYSKTFTTFFFVFVCLVGIGPNSFAQMSEGQLAAKDLEEFAVKVLRRSDNQRDQATAKRLRDLLKERSWNFEPNAKTTKGRSSFIGKYCSLLQKDGQWFVRLEPQSPAQPMFDVALNDMDTYTGKVVIDIKENAGELRRILEAMPKAPVAQRRVEITNPLSTSFGGRSYKLTRGEVYAVSRELDSQTTFLRVKGQEVPIPKSYFQDYVSPEEKAAQQEKLPLAVLGETPFKLAAVWFPDTDGRLRISEVVNDGLGQRIGLLPNDVISKLNGVTIRNSNDYSRILRLANTFTLTVSRNNRLIALPSVRLVNGRPVIAGSEVGPGTPVGGGKGQTNFYGKWRSTTKDGYYHLLELQPATGFQAATFLHSVVSEFGEKNTTNGVWRSSVSSDGSPSGLTAGKMWLGNDLYTAKFNFDGTKMKLVDEFGENEMILQKQ